MKRLLILAAALLLIDGVTHHARADITAFVGAQTSPSNRLVRGVALGIDLLILGIEFEYADTREDEAEGAPALRTGMGNLYVQTPFPIAGLQFYATVGGGLYRERLGARQETHLAGNLGGGVKITLAGPLRARLDYRVLNLRGSPLFARPQRVYAGLNLMF